VNSDEHDIGCFLLSQRTRLRYLYDCEHLVGPGKFSRKGRRFLSGIKALPVQAVEAIPLNVEMGARSDRVQVHSSLLGEIGRRARLSVWRFSGTYNDCLIQYLLRKDQGVATETVGGSMQGANVACLMRFVFIATQMGWSESNTGDLAQPLLICFVPLQSALGLGRANWGARIMANAQAHVETNRALQLLGHPNLRHLLYSGPPAKAVSWGPSTVTRPPPSALGRRAAGPEPRGAARSK